MATIHEKLNQLHELVIDQLLAELRSGEASNETRRLALQLLKQNDIAAPIVVEAPNPGLAGKLDFSALGNKVRPLRPAAGE